MAPLNALVHSEPVNALIGWLLIGVVALAAVESLLTNAVLWGGVLSFIVAISILPSLLTSDRLVMVPWPLLVPVAVAALIRAFGLYLETAGYVAIAAFALIVVVELDAFTSVQMSRRFAVGFAVLTTLAVQGLWIIAQFYSDLWLGTGFLHSQRELQVDIVIVTGIGFGMGVVFEWYFDRVEHVGSHQRPISPSR